MAHDRIVAVCDACVLYPFHLRNILVQLAVDGLFEAHWSDDIHDEWTRNLLVNVPSIPPARLHRTRQLMDAVLPMARIDGFHHRIASIHIPDANDRHVVAAAIEAKASHILTWNLSDFPITALEPYGLIRATPDTFLAELHDQMPAPVEASLENARLNLRRSSMAQDQFLDMLRDQNLVELVARLKSVHES